MDNDDAISRLAARHGIESHYDDVANRRHDAAPETFLALLRACGVEASNAEDARAALAVADAVSEALPPVMVVRVAEMPVVIALNAWAASRPLHWELTLENGGSVSGDTQSTQSTLRLPGQLPCGYHQLKVKTPSGPGGLEASMTLIVCPRHCYQPAFFGDDARVWGFAVQLYALRSARNWGIGDFTDLTMLAEFAKAAGADVIGLNPLHALFADRPERASPYSPSNRAALNALYLDVEAVPQFSESVAARQAVSAPAFQQRLAQLRATSLVDYANVAVAKHEILEILYADFRRVHLANDTDQALAFRRFQEDAGPGLRQHGLFESLQERFSQEDPTTWGWPAWPSDYASPHADAVANFAEARRERVEYYEYLQWNAQLQLGAVASRMQALGLVLGLYRDLAVGVDPGGAEAWAYAHLYAKGASVGAPPDEFNPKGQDWGLPPFVPDRLRAAAYAPFVDILRANMRDAGALRIDHVMGLMRLFWIPAGTTPGAGAYVRYPLPDLLGILALESTRHRCVIVGEALGTVPKHILEAMATDRILSYRPLFFERLRDGEFAPPESYPADSLVTASTHDLPTLAGYWRAVDLDAREALNLFPTPALRDQQRSDRLDDRLRLLRALESSGDLPPGVDPEHPPDELDAALVASIHRFLGRTPARIFMLQMEDVLGQVEQINLPSTTEDVYPNWRRKLPLALEEWTGDTRVDAILRAVRDAR